MEESNVFKHKENLDILNNSEVSLNIINHKGTIELETDRLILRKFNFNDINAMYNNWATDTKVTRYMTHSTYNNKEEVSKKIDKWVEEYKSMSFYRWAIELKMNKELIGYISAGNSKENIKSIDLGYCIGSRWWNQGIVTEAGTAVIKYLFEQIGYNRIVARCAKDNIGSERVMQKLGMKREGILRQAGYCNQGITDILCYSILREEFKHDLENLK